MDAGASGVAFGLKVWGSSDPVAVVRALIRVVREQAPVEDAAEALIEQDGWIAATPGSTPLHH
jgi:hypothetical protein